MQLTPGEPAPRPSNDNRAPTPRELRDDLVMALRFFSRLPTGNTPHEAPSLRRIAPALPFASLIIGLGPALLLAVLLWLKTPPGFAATLAVAAMAMVTGAMSEDALGDAADGLFGGATPKRRLEIMKDSRHGTFGVLAIVLLVLARIFALSALGHPLAAAGVMLTAPLLARSASLWLAVKLPPARSTGAAAAAGQLDLHRFGFGLGVALLLSVVLAGFAVGWIGLLLAAMFSAVLIWGWTALCSRLVGGQTGDLIGALQALIEMAVLTGFMIAA